jgi:4-hydroxybenzoate polyprenyltransferase
VLAQRLSTAELRALADLVRLPAALTVPGDLLLGAAAGGRRAAAATVPLSAASTCLYWAGMALNDWADRGVDAVERPGRPIPSGRVRAATALALAGGLTGAGLGLAAAAGGRRALGTAAPLAAAVWSYDLWLKRTPLGPAGMALCRSLNVLLGATAGRRRRALPAAAVVGVHTAVITTVSRSEARGAGSGLPRAAAAATAAVALAAGCRALAGARRASRAPLTAAASLALLGAYATSNARAQAAAVAEPSAANLQRVVGTGILGFIPLQAALAGAAGAHPAPVATVAAAWPLARRLARRRSPT